MDPREVRGLNGACDGSAGLHGAEAPPGVRADPAGSLHVLPRTPRVSQALPLLLHVPTRSAEPGSSHFMSI